MEHFSTESWLDYSRGVATVEPRVAMQQHLEDGCQACQSIVRHWTLVHQIALRDRHNQPPAGLVQTVKESFGIEPQAEQGGHALWNIGKLILNSFLEPSLAPVRAGTSGTQQLVFEARPFVIDLQLTAEVGRPRNYLTGQILCDQPTDTTPSGVVVRLLSGEQQMAESRASEQGEFDFDVSRRRSLSLQFQIPGHQPILVRLPD